jgi:hypothetical protein
MLPFLHPKMRLLFMLAPLFGNKNIERILLFLFVNERCYGTQLQTLLKIPLTPIQKALARLEKGSIVDSHYEGNMRVYQLNPDYPCRSELETLLKKAYAHLPTQEKKQYCYIHKPKLRLKEERIRNRNARAELLAFWEKLEKVEQLTFSATSRTSEEKTGKMGKADVLVTHLFPSTLIFHEKGHWLLGSEPDTAFSNSFRWTLDLASSLITLEHLRYGPPVFLLHLTPTKPFCLESVDSHLCAEDTYLGNILWNPGEIRFHWRIIGPRKNDELIYHYT